MPVALTYPGVYVEEIPSGVRTIVGVATSITAFLGRTIRGPLNDPTTIFNFGDFERQFGGLDVGYPLSYAVRDFFINGGSQALIVRLYKAAAGASGAAAFNVADTIKLVASSPGAWGKALRATIDTDVSDETKASLGLAKTDLLFNLTVRDTNPGGATEKYRNLSIKESPRRIDRVLNAESSLVRWDGVYDATTIIVPKLATANSAQKTLDDAQKPLADAKKALAAVNPTDAAAVKAAQDKVDAAQKAADAAKASADSATVDLGSVGAQADNALAAALKAKPPVPTDIAKAEQAVAKAEADMVAADSGALAAAEFEGKQADKTGLYALDKADLFNLLCIPPDTRNGDASVDVYQIAMAYCAYKRAMLIVDPPAAWSSNKDTAAASAKKGLADLGLNGVSARNAALYFPRVTQADPLRNNQLDAFVPCGIVAGVMATTDTNRGVWKAPAGIDAGINGTRGLDVTLSDDENGVLNPLGINCLRSFPIVGRVVWGARTLRGADQLADEYKYVPVRRTALYIEESLYRGLKWVVFEPNDEPLWAQIRLNVGAFMHNLFRQGAFQGQTPRDAYFVKCDKETTTQNDINLGIVNVVVGFAPLKPAEFVVIKLQQMAGQIET